MLFTDGDPDRTRAHKWGMSQRPYLYDVAAGRREPLAEFPENAQCLGVAWSPDGGRVAYTWERVHEELLKKHRINLRESARDTEAFLVVADADGKTPKTVASDKSGQALNPILGSLDWR